ncbi:MAG: hypothetical protein KA035_01445 [Candidatus Levybacteria bacterium]|nr:hypothetical protein [Candidatus Levybacteria bacterium]
MFIPVWAIFLFLGLIHSLFYALNRNDIFVWHPDPNEPVFSGNTSQIYDKRKLLREQRNHIRSAPLAWKIEQFLHVFLGVAAGWFFLWVLLDERIDIFNSQNFDHLEITDLFIFLLGWIGINGRLPSIAHAIVDFMKSGINIGR